MTPDNTGTTTTTAAVAPAIAAFDSTKTYAAGDKYTIDFDGKQITVSYVRPGVSQKTASIFYIRDSVTGEWLYCFPQRLTTLIEKGVDLANYKGRETKAAARKDAKVQKATEKEARAKAAQEAAAAAMAKVANAQPVVAEVPQTAEAPAEKPAEVPTGIAPTAEAPVLKKAAKKK